MHLPEGFSSNDELVTALRHGSTREHAFRMMVRTWQRPLHGHLHRALGNHNDAADALQETWVKVLKGIESYRGESSLQSWVYAIANRTAIDMLRSRQRNLNRWGDDKIGLDEDSGAPLSEQLADPNAWNAWHGHDAWNEQASLERFVAAVQSLPDRQRVVFVFRYFQGMSYRSMAESMDVTESTLKSLYHHAKAKLMAHLA